jgi:60 kDa SS-A/Ro ribonucleoprotein
MTSQLDELVPMVARYKAAQEAVTPEQAIAAVREHSTPWEWLPSRFLSNPDVWEALIETVGITALMRNLARMSRIGTLPAIGGVTTERVVSRLTNTDAVQRGRIHPMTAWLAQQTYMSGSSQPHLRKPPTRWQPNPRIGAALSKTMQAGFATALKCGKNIAQFVDASGSMQSGLVLANGSRVGDAYQTACTVAAIMAKIEPNLVTLDFDSTTSFGWALRTRREASGYVKGGPGVYQSRITPETDLSDIHTWRPHGGGTDLSLPFQWAIAHKVNVDGFVIYTDDETWAGRQHPTEALTAYRAAHNPQAKVAVVTLTPAGHTIGDPQDPGVINIAGMDASLPQVLTGWFSS